MSRGFSTALVGLLLGCLALGWLSYAELREARRPVPAVQWTKTTWTDEEGSTHEEFTPRDPAWTLEQWYDIHDAKVALRKGRN